MADQSGLGQTIAIQGPWGNGKTSVLNLITESLSTNKIPIAHFNPWLFANASDLASRFFLELGTQIGL